MRKPKEVPGKPVLLPSCAPGFRFPISSHNGKAKKASGPVQCLRELPTRPSPTRHRPLPVCRLSNEASRVPKDILTRKHSPGTSGKGPSPISKPGFPGRTSPGRKVPLQPLARSLVQAFPRQAWRSPPRKRKPRQGALRKKRNTTHHPGRDLPKGERPLPSGLPCKEREQAKIALSRPGVPPPLPIGRPPRKRQSPRRASRIEPRPLPGPRAPLSNDSCPTAQGRPAHENREAGSRAIPMRPFPGPGTLKEPGKAPVPSARYPRRHASAFPWTNALFPAGRPTSH